MMSEALRAERGFAHVNGARLYYEIAGSGSPLVLLHDGIADSGMWDAQFAVLAATHRVLRYDLRGAGQSLLPDGPFSPVGDLLTLLDQGHFGPAVLIGCGLGGRLAIDCCLAHPERVTALLLLGPALSGYVWTDAMIPYLVAVDAALAAGNVPAAVEADLRQWVDGPGRAADAVDPDVRARVREMTAQGYAAAEGDGAPEPAGRPALDRLSEIGVPVLVVLGEYESPDMRRIADRLEVVIAGARQIIIPGAGHLANMEQPASFNEMVAEFLASLPSVGDPG